jgi:hypothetical protein
MICKEKEMYETIWNVYGGRQYGNEGVVGEQS